MPCIVVIFIPTRVPGAKYTHTNTHSQQVGGFKSTVLTCLHALFYIIITKTSEVDTLIIAFLPKKWKY